MFKNIAIFSKKGDIRVTKCLDELEKFFKNNKLNIVYSDKSDLKAEQFNTKNVIDLAVVIGGDGTMLRISRMLAPHAIPVIGINHGRLGFLTEITTARMLDDLKRIIDGEYYIQKRTMLHCAISNEKKILDEATALNDIVIGRGRIGRLIEFEISVNDQFVSRTRGDGLIISTPTGSTAYALAADGPIIQPGLDVIALVPICPHTLSHRPIVISGNSDIVINLISPEETEVIVSVDGHIEYTIKNEEQIEIKRSQTCVDLVHLNDYNYYDALRSKLGWSGALN